ncbi:MAG: ankyrin repeat domain-containing protein [Marinosulfonomonas sp.]|nr:ankyrin repeat domain-containing protein [Marinosulfonomonas sp.]
MFCNRLLHFSVVILAVWVSAENANAETIHLMARKGDVAAVMAEIDKGVDVNLPSTRHTSEAGASPLFIAARFGKADVVVALIGAGADIHKFLKEPHGGTHGTPLHAASRFGSVEVVEVLLEAGADPNVDGPVVGTPLHLALWHGHLEIAQTLIAAGATERVVQAPISSMLAGASLELGKEAITGCGACHSLVADRNDPDIGPTLWGIVGRPIASVEGFEYSSSMAAENGSWDYKTLNSFIAAPKLYMPGSHMRAVGEIDDVTRRAAAIAYLRTLADNPLPLP